jgi:K+-transporting ATPase A subunit
VFLSIAGTLFITLLTSSFNSIGDFTSEKIATVAWILTVICAIIGFILMGYSVSKKMKNDVEVRDKTIDEISEQHINKENN